MNKSDLVDAAAQATGLTKADTDKTLNALLAQIVACVAKGEAVTLIGFGTFKAAARAARSGKNPKTGAALKIPATTVPRFSAGASFKAAVAPQKQAGKKK